MLARYTVFFTAPNGVDIIAGELTETPPGSGLYAITPSSLALYVLKTGDTMSGTLTLGALAKLILTGGVTNGAGNIQMGAAPNLAWDSNMLYVDAQSRTMGIICSSSPAFTASNGPFLALRGLTYSTYANQRGLLALSAGNPTGPFGGVDGCITFASGADVTRMTITPLGKIKIDSAVTAASAGDPSVLQVAGNVSPVVGGDVYALYVTPTVTRAGAGNHVYVIGTYIQQPTIGGGAAGVVNAITFYIEGPPASGTNKYAMWVRAGLCQFDGTLKVGTSGTALSQIRVYTPTLTPATALLPGTTAEEAFTVTGLSTADTVSINPPAQTAGIAIAGVRVSGVDTLAIQWANVMVAGVLTPATGVYRIVAVRS